MAQFIPSIEKIQQLRVQPTEGEWYLLHFLENTLDDSFEVYFTPFLNGDRPDVIIMRKGGGVMIVEVKDWDLDLYEVDEKRHWYLKHPKNEAEAHARLSSPVQQAYKYKENLFDLHIPGLLELKIKDIRRFNFVTCAVYFHNANEEEVKSKLVNPFEKDYKYQNFLKYNIDLLGRDSLNEQRFKKILYSRYFMSSRPSQIFTDDIYQSFKHHLTPTRHLMSEGEAIQYSEDQRDLIYDDKSRSWRVKGVVGSGKTTVLAAKAVESCKRVLAEGRTPRILILTYNITLKNFIRDKLSRVRADFEWSYFTILNYNKFIGTMMNELGIPFEMPQQGPEETHKQYMRRVSSYLNDRYYNNRNLFKGYEESIKNRNGSFFKLTKTEYEVLLDLIRQENPEPESNPIQNAVDLDKYTKTDFLYEVFMTSEAFDELTALLKLKQNVILQGAPGVGKTFSAKRIAYAMMGEKDSSRIEMVQFHQNYSYEDFIMSYKPLENGGFELKSGVFYNFCKRAEANKGKPYFFIIDEINRGNLSKIFGELLMLIEKDYRGTEIKLAYRNELFTVPENLYIIGMMNTADRSLAMIDYALRRRFSFYSMKPGLDTDGFKKEMARHSDERIQKVVYAVKVLNDKISKDDSLGEGFCIGHSYFCGKKADESWIESVVKYDLCPMLDEYWFDSKETCKSEKDKLLDIIK